MAPTFWRTPAVVLVAVSTVAAGLGVAAGASESVQLAAQVAVSSPDRDTHVLRSRPGRQFGGSHTLLVPGRRGQALASVPTPTLDGAVRADLCVTPKRGSATRLKVFSASSEWSESISWRTRPARERSLLGRSTTRPVAGRELCAMVPVAALETGATEFRLQSSRRRKTIRVYSSEARADLAPRLEVSNTMERRIPLKTPVTTSPTPTATPTGTTSPTATASPTETTSPTATTSPTETTSPTASGKVLWDGGFEQGGVPHGAGGPACGTGNDDGPDGSLDEYRVVDEHGNSNCTSEIRISNELTRTADSKRALKIVMGANQQRQQPRSKFTWTPDSKGSVDHWYGFSMFYGADWNLGGGLLGEVDATTWHSAASWRTSGPNGSLNFSGDMNLNNADGKPYPTFSTPHMVLRRNTVKNNEGFYKDGKGLDKIDLGPIVTGKWMDFVCHIRWSTTSTNALRECWRDGVYMGARTSLNAVDTNPHTFRVGQYQITSIGHKRTTYIDNARIGTSYAAVDPSRAR